MVRRVSAVAMGSLAFLLLTGGVAFGHAAFKTSSPEAKTTVDSPPDQVSVEFTEPVTHDSRIEVFDPCGRQVDDGASHPRGKSISVGVSAAAAGTYTARFLVVSNLDGHPTRGRFTFTLGDGEECPQATGATTDVPEETSLFDFPAGGALLAFGSAVLIGAAGGYVYAGIMGPIR
jgi:methionine-rich copper-binding protein CopC